MAREVLADGRLGAPRVDGGRIGAKVLEVRLVEAVAFVRERAERYLHQRVDEEAWDDGAIGVAARLLVGDQLLRRHEHGRRRPRDVGVHVRVAVDLAVAETVGTVHVQQRDVGKERGHGGQRLAGVGIGDRLHAADGDEVGAEHREGGEERHAHGRRAEAQAEGQVAPLLEGHRAGLDVVAHDLRYAPRQADRHPRRHHALDGAGRHHELALRAHEVAHQRQAAASRPQDFAHEGQRRAREEAATDGDAVALRDPRGRVVDRGELLAGRFGLGLQPPPRGDKVPLGRSQRRISHFDCQRSSSRRVLSSIGCARSGTSTCLASPHSAVVK